MNRSKIVLCAVIVSVLIVGSAVPAVSHPCTNGTETYTYSCLDYTYVQRCDSVWNPITHTYDQYNCQSVKDYFASTCTGTTEVCVHEEHKPKPKPKPPEEEYCSATGTVISPVDCANAAAGDDYEDDHWDDLELGVIAGVGSGVGNSECPLANPINNPLCDEASRAGSLP